MGKESGLFEQTLRDFFLQDVCDDFEALGIVKPTEAQLDSALDIRIAGLADRIFAASNRGLFDD